MASPFSQVSVDAKSTKRMFDSTLRMESLPTDLRGHSRRNRSGGGASSFFIPAKVLSKQGESYTVELYANGKSQVSTGRGVLDVVQVHFADSVRINSWIVVCPGKLGVISGN